MSDIDFLARHAVEIPAKIALVSGTRLVDFESLNRRSIQAADVFRKLGCELHDRVAGLLDGIGLRVDPPDLAEESLVTAMGADKKRRGGRSMFVVPTGRVGAGLDPCAVLRTRVLLSPGEKTEIVFLLGQGEDAGRARGLSRVSAARFSFLLATPITFGAGLLELRHLGHDTPAPALLVGVVTSAIVGLLAIRLLIRYLGRSGFAVFFVYRTAFAALIAWRLIAR